MSLRDEWERVASQWAAWAREPGHDSYWTHSRSPFLELVPPPGRATLDVGCGEGRVARDLKQRGHHVTGVDVSPTLVRLAKEADPNSRYVVADAAALPFDDESFDLAVAFNSLMDMDDLEAAVGETARVLEHGGRLCISIVHPIVFAGDFETADSDARFVIDRDYFAPAVRIYDVERSSLTMSFTSRTRPLESYSRAFEQAGFLIEAMREPPDPEGGRMARIPNFLLMRLVKAQRADGPHGTRRATQGRANRAKSASAGRRR